MARDHLAPRRRHHARHNKMVRRMAIINRKKGEAQAWRYKTSRHRRRFNPGHDADFVKHFRDGGRIEVWNDGEVCVFDNMDRDQDDYHLKPHEVPALIRDVNAAKFGAWHHYTKDMVRDDYEMQGRGKKRNPRGRKRGGGRFTKARSGRKWESAVSGSMPYWANPRKGYTQDAVQVLFDEGKQFLSEGEIGQCKDVIGELDEHGPEGRKAGQALAKRMGKMGHTYKKYRSSRPSTVAMLSRWQDEDRGVLSEMRSNPRGHRGSRRKNRRHFSVHETTGTSGRFRTRRGRHQVSKAYKKRGYIHGRRNPDVNGNAGKAHPAYGQYLMKLGFGMNDPIVELGAAWARGEAGGSRLIQQAIISAERSMENRDRRVAQNAKNVANKLRTYLKEQERHEGYRHKSGFKAGTLVGAARFANPRRRGRGRR